ncbi:MAG: winged helix-turn-helix domain-containing protein [Vicinamibacterales bacterium]
MEADGHFVIGEGALELFEGLEREGSLTLAARAIGWSYRHAWGYLRRAERLLGIRLTENIHGKGGQRGTTLTRDARELVNFLREARNRARSAVDCLGRPSG